MIVEECKKHDIGFLAMKAMAGGLITNASAAFAFMRRFDNVLPLWGIQRESELDEFLALEANPHLLEDDGIKAAIERDRAELTGNFCRGCGYCMPCPAGIPLNFATRMVDVLNRLLAESYLTDEWNGKMSRIENCTECGQCKDKCPYNLEIPVLIKKNLVGYREIYEARRQSR